MMDNLIGEVNKVAAFAKAEQVTAADIAAVAEPVLDARIFDMTNHISARDYNKAAAVLGDLLRMQTEPIVILGAIGRELRRLYTARMALDSGKDRFLAHGPVADAQRLSRKAPPPGGPTGGSCVVQALPGRLPAVGSAHEK